MIATLVGSVNVGLFWSNEGTIACREHAPFPGSDTWVNCEWQEITIQDRAEWARLEGKEMVCETCAIKAFKSVGDQPAREKVVR